MGTTIRAPLMGDIQEAVTDTYKDVIRDYVELPDTDRETLIKRLDQEGKDLFGLFVQTGHIDQYDAEDLVQTASACAVIIQTAEADAWVEDDSGLWEGLTFGVLATIAFYSLRNLLYQKMENFGYDSNKKYPFEVTENEE